MKRICNLVLAAVLLLACMVSNIAYAEGTCDFVISVSEISTENTITATLAVTQNPGISGIDLNINFDNTKLKLKSADEVGTFSGMVFSHPSTFETINSLSVLWANTNIVTKTGALVTMTFDVLEGSWTETPLTITVNELSDGTNSIPYTVSNATVTKPAPAHTHTPGAEWLKSADEHWHACTGENCNEKLDIAEHTWNIKTEAGIKTFTCTICDYQKTEPIVDPIPNPNPDTPNTGSGAATGSGIDATESTTSAPLPPVTGDQDGILAICLLAVSAGIIFFVKKAKKAR